MHLTIKRVWKPRRTENWTILLEVLDLIFTKKVHSESWSSTNVSPSVVAAKTTLQNFSLASFWSLPTNLSQQHVLSCQVHKIQWFSCRMITYLSKLVAFPSQDVSLDLVQLQAKSLPQEIAQFWRATSFPSRNCIILSGSLLGSRIAQFC